MKTESLVPDLQCLVQLLIIRPIQLVQAGNVRAADATLRGLPLQLNSFLFQYRNNQPSIHN